MRFSQRPIEFESLEGRTLFAAVPVPVTAGVVDGFLEVTGTRKADAISVAVSAERPDVVEVHAGTDGALLGTFIRSSFANGIVIVGGAGNDTITVAAGITVSVVISGDAGKDVLTGGGGNDVIDGGAGNDRLAGGAGDDLIDGGAGNDQIDGGTGEDSLSGGAGKDAVTGGFGTDLFDDDRASEILDRTPDEFLSEPLIVVGRRR